MPAILFGSISTVADTSELQREAFNRAFAEHGLGWTWDREDYRDRLVTAGGRQRIADYAQARGETVDAAAVHATKSRIFQESLAGSGLTPRPGVAEVVKGAHERGLKLGLVTTTSQDNVSALLAALAPAVQASDFDLIVDAGTVDQPKPAPDSYIYAMSTLHEGAQACVAIEDNPDGVIAAVGAGLACLAFPNENTAGHDFPQARQTVDHLDLDALQSLV